MDAMKPTTSDDAGSATLQRTNPITPAYRTDAQRWQAVKSRDRTADGQFYYSVASTGVYCRPSCGARLPRRENVAFHQSAADAERAGFRPCKRCRPDARQIGYAFGTARVGKFLVAATEHGLCAILLGDTQSDLYRELAAQFPDAVLQRGFALSTRRLAHIAAYLDAPTGHLGVPLDVHGTAFQRRVWRALGEIPAGSTASYGEIARRIGTPAGARAIARACAANPLAVAIPCHRVVRSDGAVSGYRWGIDRKRRLLAREAAA